MAGLLNIPRLRNPKFLLMYSPLQFLPGEIAKPDGSLSLAYLAGTLRRAGYDVNILDCSVGDKDNSLQETFFRSTPLESGLLRVGMSPEMIAKRVSEYDVIGVSSIFTAQTSMVLALIRLVKEVHPHKLVIAGGVNARSLRSRFFDSGADIIALSEAEDTIVRIAEALRGKCSLTEVPGIAFRNEHGEEIVNACQPMSLDLDQLPFPAWDLLPLEKYWDISRPHGGQFPEDKKIKYASLQTSRGCPFQCLYCHISKEKEDDQWGGIGKFRTKSIDRVLGELEVLKNLGVEYIFLEDDSLFAKKNRAYKLFKLVRETGLHLLDVNGINICHLQRNEGGKLRIDTEFIEVLAEAGFRFLTLPFESASQRLLDIYASSKWSIETTDVKQLLKALEANKIKAAGNYMIGYPCETEAEIHSTILMAKRHIEQGLNHALFFAVVPFPGSILFDKVIANGQLDPNFDTDTMRWTKSIIKNLAMSSDALENVRQLAWLTVNRADYVKYKYQMVVNSASSSMVSRM
jgi:radical SAM superfamily enzyme YgiQ (UPF0313 family)